MLIGQAHANRTPRDRQYATIVFARSKAVPKALKLNGLEIDGFKISVSRARVEGVFIDALADLASRCVLARQTYLTCPKLLGGASTRLRNAKA